MRATVSGRLAAIAPGETAASIIAAANRALYEAKHRGRDRISTASAAPGRAQATWQQRIVAAVQAPRIELRFRPLVGLADGEPEAEIATVGLGDRQRLFAAPSTFQPVAAGRGLLAALDCRVLEAVLRHVADHPRLPVLFPLRRKPRTSCAGRGGWRRRACASR